MQVNVANCDGTRLPTVAVVGSSLNQIFEGGILTPGAPLSSVDDNERARVAADSLHSTAKKPRVHHIRMVPIQFHIHSPSEHMVDGKYVCSHPNVDFFNSFPLSFTTR
jgi:hypothetical protein